MAARRLASKARMVSTGAGSPWRSRSALRTISGFSRMMVMSNKAVPPMCVIHEQLREKKESAPPVQDEGRLVVPPAFTRPLLSLRDFLPWRGAPWDARWGLVSACALTGVPGSLMARSGERRPPRCASARATGLGVLLHFQFSIPPPARGGFTALPPAPHPPAGLLTG